MDKIILKKAENQVRQQLFGGLALLVAALMVGNITGTIRAADNVDVTNLSFNVTTGAFTLVNAPVKVNFPAMNFGESNSAHVSNENMDGVEITDYRGSATAWEVVANASEMNNGGAAVIAATRLKIDNNGTARNITAGDTNRVAVLAADGPLNDGGSTIINGSTQASGVFGYDNAQFLLNVTGSDVAASYVGVVTFTLS
jgi:hypothetical protein